MDSTYISLGGTKTYADQQLLWVPRQGDEGDEGDGRTGTMILATVRNKVKKKVADDVYAVEEIQQQPGVIGRTFLIVKSNGECYETHIGRECYCKCKFGETNRGEHCKHIKALLKLIECGDLPNVYGAKMIPAPVAPVPAIDSATASRSNSRRFTRR